MREAPYTIEGEPRIQHERYFVVRTERFAPRSLGALLERLLREGLPRRPISIGR